MLAEGQRHPVLVVADAESRYVLVDGYRRVRALAALGRRPEAIEEAWLLRALLTEHGLDLRTLATRTGRTVSWVSRRLGLVEALPTWAVTNISLAVRLMYAEVRLRRMDARVRMAEGRTRQSTGRVVDSNITGGPRSALRGLGIERNALVGELAGFPNGHVRFTLLKQLGRDA